MVFPRHTVRELGTFEELHYEKRLEGLREGIWLQDYTSEVIRGRTVKDLRSHIKDFDLESIRKLLKEYKYSKFIF